MEGWRWDLAGFTLWDPAIFFHGILDEKVSNKKLGTLPLTGPWWLGKPKTGSLTSELSFGQHLG